MPKTGFELQVEGTLYRRAEIAPGPVDLETRRMKVRLSSEHPVVRNFKGKKIFEVLDHSPESIDFSMATGERRLPFLDDHNPTETLGSHPEVALDAHTRAINAVAEFSTSPQGERAMHDFNGSHRRDMSAGYKLTKILSVRQFPGDPYPTVRFAWQLKEGSSVSQGADPTATIRRAAEDIEEYTLNFEETEEVRKMPGTGPVTPPNDKPEAGVIPPTNEPGQRAAPTAPVSGHVQVSLEDQRRVEENRVANIRAAAKIGIQDMGLDHSTTTRKANDLIFGDQGGDASAMAIFVMSEFGKKNQGQRAAGDVDMSKEEQKEYSLTRILEALFDGNAGKASFEKEISDECMRSAPAGANDGRDGFMIPLLMMKRNVGSRFTAEDHELLADHALLQKLGIRAAGTMDPKVAAQGGNWITNNATPGMMYDALVDATWFDKVGVRRLNMGGTFTIPGVSALMTPAARGDEEDAALSHFTTQTRTMSPKIVSVQTDLTGLMRIEGARFGIEALTSSLIGESMGLKLGQYATDGTGANNQIRGIKNISGSGLVALGTNGAAPDWDMIVDMETSVNNANIRTGSTSYIFNTTSVGTMKKTPKVSGEATMLIEPPAFAGVDLAVNGHKLVQSNQLPADLTKGTGTSLSMGSFVVGPHLYWAAFGGTRIIRDDVTAAARDKLKIIAHSYNDFIAVYPGAVVNVVDILNA